LCMEYYLPYYCKLFKCNVIFECIHILFSIYVFIVIGWLVVVIVVVVCLCENDRIGDYNN
jgi:hypothetical protein